MSRLSWQPRTFQEVVARVDQTGGDLYGILVQAALTMGSLSCPAPAWDADGTYRVVAKGDQLVIERHDVSGVWMPADLHPPKVSPIEMTPVEPPRHDGDKGSRSVWEKLLIKLTDNLVEKAAVAIVGLIALALGGLTSSVYTPYTSATSRIEKALGERSGFEKRIWPRLGIGLLKPSAWSVDSAPYAFGGGEFDLIRTYDSKDNSIAEGLKFAIRTVQANYVTHPDKEESNQFEVYQRSFTNVTLSRVALGGRVGPKFSYHQRTGQRVGVVERYWVRLSSRVKLEIIVFSNLPQSYTEFSREATAILDSVFIDDETIAVNAARIGDMEAGQVSEEPTNLRVWLGLLLLGGVLGVAATAIYFRRVNA